MFSLFSRQAGYMQSCIILVDNFLLIWACVFGKHCQYQGNLAISCLGGCDFQLLQHVLARNPPVDKIIEARTARQEEQNRKAPG